MSDKTLNISPALYKYIQQVFLREPDSLKALRAETLKLSEAMMQISPEQGQLMRLLVELIQAKKTLDIGTFTGYSALAVALGLPNDGKVITCDINSTWTNVAKKFWQEAGVLHKIELRLGPALETLQALIDKGEKESFDFIFIDADKSNYQSYYEKSLSLLRRGGLIAIDNVLWDGKVADLSINDPQTEAIRALNSALQSDQRVATSLIPIGDGLTLARKH